MAGIGFELKKVFKRNSVVGTLKGYAISGVVVTGPMFLSITLLIGLRHIYEGFGIHMTAEREMISCLITYATLFSVVWVNTFSIVVIRYVSDALYLNQYEKVMPSFYGSISLLLLFGEVIFGLFLLIMRIPTKALFLSLVLFAIYVVVWMQINYLSSIKNYKGLLTAFAAAVAIGLLVGYLLIKFFKGDVSYAIIIAVIFTYTILAVCNQIMLAQFFPKGKGSMFAFLEVFETHSNLFITGLFMQMGLYGHIIVMWLSPAGEVVSHGLRQCTTYDMPAMVAFLTGIVTMINIVVSLEVNFYQYFSRYLNLLNKGSIVEIKNAEERMKESLYDEIYYCVAKQFLVTISCIVFGSMLLRSSFFGMTEEMIGIFRVLCVGYGAYACGYALVLVMFYLNYKKVYVVMAVFAACTILLGFVFSLGPESLYGVGFTISGIVLFISSLFFLRIYMKDVLLHIFVDQQMIKENTGFMTRLARKSEELYPFKDTERKAEA